MIYVILAIVVIIVLMVVFFPKNSRENYGGPIKRIRRIPRTTCHNICGQYFNNCMAQYKYTDAGLCDRRYWNCIAQCDYTDFHRL